MSPEAQILIINATILAIAYIGIYPSQNIRHIVQMIPTDLVLASLSLIMAGALFAGSGIRFSLILFETGWFLFALITMMLMEVPLFLWFCHKNDIDMNGRG
ncbi:MAG: hypothetical protein ACK5II_07830 [Paracoccus sp. (in: a-proteobacteria)]